MKQIQLDNGYLLVGNLPEGSCEFINGGLQLYTHKMSPEIHNTLMNLFYQPYDIICFAKDITEEQAKGIVVLNGEGFEHYMSDEEFATKDYVYALPTALESFHSLLKSHELKPENCLILKKN